MSSYLTLTDEIEALLPEELNVHLGTVTQRHLAGGQVGYVEDDLPWTVLNIRFPLILDRSPAATAHGGRVLITTTIAGLTDESVGAQYDRLRPHLEGARPLAAGWNVSPITELNARPIETDRDVTFIDSNRMPRFAVIEWEMTVSRK